MTRRKVPVGAVGKAEYIVEMNRRHLAGVRFIKERALAALVRMPLEEVLAAARKLDSRRSTRSKVTAREKTGPR